MSEGKIVLRRLKETLDVLKGKTIIGQVDFQIRNMVEDCIDVIETQKAEIEKKDKMIDKMAENLTSPIYNKKEVIEYFFRLVEGEKKDG